MNKIKVGILSYGYAEKRNINFITDAKYVKINFLNRASYAKKYKHLLEKANLVKKSKNEFYKIYKSLFPDKFFYDIAHFFNTISLSDVPWICTFETTAPYFRKEINEFLSNNMNINDVENLRVLEKGIAACAKGSCKALISISQCSLEIERELVSNFPSYEKSIIHKLKLLYPPQKLFVDSFQEKKITLEGKIKFMFVGKDIYRKGGLEMLRCFDKLWEVYNLELILISNLKNDIEYLVSEKMKDELEQLLSIGIKNKWLTFYEKLENEKVLELMKKAHIGLLPTYSDTFGYSVLEFQASGCPVITTDVRALPEINNNECGWIIPVGKKTKHGEILEINTFVQSRTIENKLFETIQEIMDHKHVIVRKANASIKRIKENHDPGIFKVKLTKLYSNQV